MHRVYSSDLYAFTMWCILMCMVCVNLPAVGRLCGTVEVLGFVLVNCVLFYNYYTIVCIPHHYTQDQHEALYNSPHSLLLFGTRTADTN